MIDKWWKFDQGKRHTEVSMKFLDDVMSGKVVLPMVPKIIERVLTLLKKEDVNMIAVTTAIEQDPVLSSRLLRLANSSFFGGKRSVASISDAVALVGTKTLHTLVVSCGAQAAFVDVPGVNLRQFWLTAAMTAAAARKIATHLRVDSDTAYSAGLLQAVGHLILCQCHKEKALLEFTSMRTLWGTELAKQELDVFGVEHAQVSALWVKKLGMPELTVDVIAHSLDPLDGPAHTLGHVVQMACNLAGSASVHASFDQASALIDHALVNLLGLDGYLSSDEFETDFAELTNVSNHG